MNQLSLFVSRLRSQARLCEFSVKCSQCETKTRHQEEMICFQLVRAIWDPEIQREALATYGKSTKDVTVAKLVSFVEAEEIGKRSQALLDFSNPGGLERIIDKENRLDEVRLKRINETGQSQNDRSTCGHCGSTEHSSNRHE